MKRTNLLASLCVATSLAIAAVSLSACTDRRPVVTPTPTSPATPPIRDLNPCGDGTRLGPNEHCP